MALIARDPRHAALNRTAAAAAAACGAMLAFGSSACFDIGGPVLPFDSGPVESGPADASETESGPNPCLDLPCAEVDVASPVTLADVQNIFNDNCTVGPCHTGSLGQGEILTPGSTCMYTVNIPAVETMGTTDLDRIEPGVPDDSYLYHKVRGTHEAVGGTGNRMPLGGCCLTPVEIGTIKRWILDGASCL